MDDAGAASLVASNQDSNNLIVQYIVVRTDLEWGTGAIIAQACHASVASIASTLETDLTKGYLVDLKNMRKIILKADKVDELLKVERQLNDANIAHHLWIEQPENIPTCLACSPQPKSLVQSIFRHFKLFK